MAPAASRKQGLFCSLSESKGRHLGAEPSQMVLPYLECNSSNYLMVFKNDGRWF